jgi:uncharacterized YigZ family protein
MLECYRTIKRYGEKEIVIRKSRFIGYAQPAATEQAALDFIAKIQKKHWDATHNCYAYIVGEHDQHQKAGDDGEPSGTAGKPILEVIKKKNLKDTVIVVTRYFGGILLGAGGLIRAYGQGASAAVEAAGVIERRLHEEVFCQVDYTWLGKLENELIRRGYRMGETRYTEKVIMSVLCPSEQSETLEKLLADITNGQAVLTRGKTQYVDFDVET